MTAQELELLEPDERCRELTRMFIEEVKELETRKNLHNNRE